MWQRIFSSRLAMVVATVVAAGAVAIRTTHDAAAGETTKKGWLGVSVQEMTPSLREAMKLGNQTGLLVTGVASGGPADEAGIKEEDVIIEFNGNKVEKSKDFARLVRNTAPETKVKMILMRKGERKTMEVIMGKRRSSSFGSGFSQGWGTAHAFSLRPRLGVQVHELNASLAAYFKVEPRSGVLVLEVTEESPAEAAGLKSGDVITKIGKETVRDEEDVIDALRDYEDGDVVKIEYVRQGKSAKAEATLEENTFSEFHFLGPEQNRLRFHHFNRGQWNDIDLIAPEIVNPQEWRNLIREEVRNKVRRATEVNLYNLERTL